MSLQEQVIRQRDFSAGEIDPDAIRRDDVDVLKSAVRYARNMVSTHTGGFTQRPGRRLLFQDDGVISEFKPFDDVSYTLVFVSGGVKVRTQDGLLVASLAAPWGADDLDSLVVETMDNEVFIAWSGWPQVITVTHVTNAWSIASYAFAAGVDSSIREPFYRFSDTQNIAMQPSGQTGVITIVFSANVLNIAHTGAIFRYAGRQLKILSVANPRTANALVIEKLPTTYQLTLTSVDGFSIGQICETDTTNVRGEIIAISTPNVFFTPYGSLTPPVANETLVGPSAASKITALGASVPGGTLQWDEAFISQYRGYPRSVSKDRQRLIFTDFPQKKNAIFWTAAGNNRDGNIGGDPDNAMLEFISAECQVYHVVGGYDEFAVTDKGVFYIPISAGTPLQPGSVEFLPIVSTELANIRPVQVTEGLIFVDKSLTGVYAITATGQTARPYIANEVNRFHRHLFNGVKSIAASSGTKAFASRQIYTVNDDGSIVVGQFNPDVDYIGWLRWEGNASIRSVTASYGKVVLMSTYDFDGDLVGVAEELDYSLLCDCAISFSSEGDLDFLELVNGTPLLLSTGQPLNFSKLVTDFFAGRDVIAFGDGFYLGERSVGEDGSIDGLAGYTSITIGVRFDWTFQPLFSHFEGGQPVGQAEKRRKVETMLATVRDTQEFKIGNRLFGSYRTGDDMMQPIPARSETYKYRETGRSYDPVVTFASTFPAKFKLIELTTRITV